jgi:hypothetical protein
MDMDMVNMGMHLMHMDINMMHMGMHLIESESGAFGDVSMVG